MNDATEDRATPEFCIAPDGRRIAFVEFGARGGHPVLYCHGFPSSRREAALLHPAALKLGLRVIAPDRPGYGASDHLPGRRLADWPADVEHLADHLGLDRFAVLGLSGGGPYALACLWRLAERISRSTLVCPLGPAYIPEVLDAMHPGARASLGMAKHFPRLTQAVFGGPTPAVLARWPGLVERLRTLGAPPTDERALAEGNNREILNSTIGDSMAGGARGARADLRLYTTDWGIPFEALDRPLPIWHGDADGTVPLAHALWYRDKLPQARLHILADQGHYSVPIQFTDRILRGLLP